MARAEDVAFFAEHGWIVVEDAIDPADLTHLGECCGTIVERRDTLAFDRACENGTERDQRDFRDRQSSPTLFFPELMDAPFRRWAVAYGTALLGGAVEFWYEMPANIQALKAHLEPPASP